MKVSPVTKAVVAAVGTLAVALAPVVADDVFSASETSGVVAALVTAAATVYGVYKARNKAVVVTPPAVEAEASEPHEDVVLD